MVISHAPSFCHCDGHTNRRFIEKSFRSRKPNKDGPLIEYAYVKNAKSPCTACAACFRSAGGPCQQHVVDRSIQDSKHRKSPICWTPPNVIPNVANNQDFLMTKKNTMILLIPAFYLIAAGALAFFYSGLLLMGTSEENRQPEVSTQVIEDVRAGKVQISNDRWLQDIQMEQTASENYRKAFISAVGLIRDFSYFSLCGTLLVVWAVFKVIERIKKAPPIIGSAAN